MTLKQHVHHLVDEMPDDSPMLADFAETLRMSRALEEAMDAVREGRTYSADEFMAEIEKAMASSSLRVILTEPALEDIGELIQYWAERGEPERGLQYSRDLPQAAILLLSNSAVARRGRYLRHTTVPEAQEIPVFKYSYRILYLVDETEGVVRILRFWHSHRQEPFQDIR